MSSSCITALKTILPDVHILNISEFFMGPGKYSSPTTVLFMQGSVSWLRNLWHVLEVFPQVMISVSSGSIGQLNPFWYCHRIPSIDTGCVIDGIWNFFVKGLKTTFNIAPMYHCYLIHIIDVATPNIWYHQIKQNDEIRTAPSLFQEHVSWSKHLPGSGPLIMICCKSIFESQGWILWCLSSKELTQAYDLPHSVQSAFLAFPVHTLPWLKSAPVKLLLHLGNTIIRGDHTRYEL